jgi:SAM-dependent methyltransferase
MSPSQNLNELFSRDVPERASFPNAAACPVCDADGAPRIFLTRDRFRRQPGIFAIHRCENCRAYFVQPRLSEQHFAGHHPEDCERHPLSRSLDEKISRGWQRFVLEHYYGYPKANCGESNALQYAVAFLLSWFTVKDAIPYRGDGKFLDIGAGSGSYLYGLKQWGWETYGLVSNAMAARRAQSLGLDVRHGTLAEARFPNAFFDVVRLSDVLEHLPHPVELFEEINRILKPDGLVYLSVPNTRSLVFWLFQKNWYALDPPRHAISYCPFTLETLCESTGFEIAHLRFSAGPFNLVRSLALFFEENAGRWPRWLRRIRWEQTKLLPRALQPLFLFIDALGYGDFLHAILRKKLARVINAARVFKKLPRAGRVTEAPVQLLRRSKHR